MNDQLLNELKNVGKINYQAMDEIKSIKCLIEKYAGNTEKIVVSNENIERLLAEIRDSLATIAKDKHRES